MIKFSKDEEFDFSNLIEKTKTKLFINRELKIDTIVTVRLNLTGGFVVNKKTGDKFLIQSIHQGNTAKGEVIGYDYFVTLKDVKFYVNQSSRRDICTNIQSKHPMAGVFGKITQQNIEISDNVIGFNPKINHLFVDYNNNFAVKEAEKATVFNGKVYCKNPTYFFDYEAPKPKNDLPSNVKFFNLNMSPRL